MDLSKLREQLQQEQRPQVDPVIYYLEQYKNNKRLSGNWRNKQQISFGTYLLHKTIADQIALQDETKQVLMGILDIMTKEYSKKYPKLKRLIEEDDDENDDEEDDEEPPKKIKKK